MVQLSRVHKVILTTFLHGYNKNLLLALLLHQEGWYCSVMAAVTLPQFVCMTQGTVEQKIVELTGSGAAASITEERDALSEEVEEGRLTDVQSGSGSVAQRATEVFKLRNHMLRSLHCVNIAKGN